MDSVPGTCTCCGVEHHFIFHSHNPQWASSDHLPHQSSHAIIQDTVWKLFSDHPGNRFSWAPVAHPYYPHFPGFNEASEKTLEFHHFPPISIALIFIQALLSHFFLISQCVLAYV